MRTSHTLPVIWDIGLWGFVQPGKRFSTPQGYLSRRQKTENRPDSRLEVVSFPTPIKDSETRGSFCPSNKRAAGITPRWEQPRRQQVQHRCGKSSSAHAPRLRTSTLHTAPCIIQSAALLGGRMTGWPPARIPFERGCVTLKINGERDCVLEAINLRPMFHPTSAPSSKTNQTLMAAMGHDQIRDPHDYSPPEPQQFSDQLRPGNKHDQSHLIVRCGWMA